MKGKINPLPFEKHVLEKLGLTPEDATVSTYTFGEISPNRRIAVSTKSEKAAIKILEMIGLGGTPPPNRNKEGNFDFEFHPNVFELTF